MSDWPAAPGVEYIERTGMGDGADMRPREREEVFRNYTCQIFVPLNVWRAKIEMVADGGGGANTNSQTKGAGPGSTGQFLIGYIDLIAGSILTYTKGIPGTGPTANNTGTQTAGGHATNSTLKGPGVNIELQGGFGGATSGEAGGRYGSTPLLPDGVSPFGYTIYASRKGGNAVNLAVGDAGESAPVLAGALGGAIAPSGGGAGSTPFGKGGRGGSMGLAGGTPEADSGAAGGGAGASTDGVTIPAGAPGAGGFLRLTWDK